jgi:hypothetical protein
MQFFTPRPAAYPPANRGRIVVWGMMVRSPFGGMIWQVLHYLVPLRLLGFDVWYVEDSDELVYDPVTFDLTESCERNVQRLQEVMEGVGLGDRWVFRPPITNAYRGALDADGVRRLYADCDAALNLCGSQEIRERHQSIRCRAYIETDPVMNQVAVASGNQELIKHLDGYHFLFTYGENLGSDDCLAPVTRYEWKKTRPPVHADWWETSEPPPLGARLTSVANWKHSGKDIEWQGQRWRWSKHHNFLRFIDLPRNAAAGMELAVGAINQTDRQSLVENGWTTSNSNELDFPDAYHRFIQQSLGEFTVAKDQYVAPRSGWFSDRSVCYLAAGRPVVTQSTGFEKFIPTGEGLFAFETRQQALDAIETISEDYPRHAAAAGEIAREYFSAEKVLRQMLATMGLC